MMTDPGFSRGAARPVGAGHVLARRIGLTVQSRAGQDVVPVGLEVSVGNQTAFLGEDPVHAEGVGDAVDLIGVLAHLDAPSVVPWTLADAVASIDGVLSLRAEIG